MLEVQHSESVILSHPYREDTVTSSPPSSYRYHFNFSPSDLGSKSFEQAQRHAMRRSLSHGDLKAPKELVIPISPPLSPPSSFRSQSMARTLASTSQSPPTSSRTLRPSTSRRPSLLSLASNSPPHSPLPSPPPSPPRSAKRDPGLYKRALNTCFASSATGQKSRLMGHRMAQRLWEANRELEQLVKLHSDLHEEVEEATEKEPQQRNVEQDRSAASEAIGGSFLSLYDDIETVDPFMRLPDSRTISCF